jgi:glycosyltransferase involved in cell wall biosynthesis
LRILASELDLDRAIDWIPAVTHEQVPDILSRISVVVLPSRSTTEWREQFGHILIEAMSMGVPVLGSTCGAIPDVIGRQELLFPEEDYPALSRLLVRAAVDPAWLAVVGEYGENRVRESYTNEVIARKLVCLWEELLS